MAQLQAIYDDLQRQSNTSLGKSIGSNTFQNLATNNALTAMGAPLNYGLSFLDKLPGANLLTSGIRRAYEGQNAPVLDALVNKLLDPSAGASAFRPAAAGGVGQNLLMGVRNYGPGVAATVNANRRP